MSSSQPLHSVNDAQVASPRSPATDFLRSPGTPHDVLDDISQPALSKQVKVLEEKIGGVLLVRNRRDVQLTKNGLSTKGGKSWKRR